MIALSPDTAPPPVLTQTPLHSASLTGWPSVMPGLLPAPWIGFAFEKQAVFGIVLFLRGALGTWSFHLHAADPGASLPPAPGGAAEASSAPPLPTPHPRQGVHFCQGDSLGPTPRAAFGSKAPLFHFAAKPPWKLFNFTPSFHRFI